MKTFPDRAWSWFASFTSCPDLAAALDYIFVSRQFLQAHRTARVQPIGRDAGFGAETELKTVGEAGRCVDINRGRIDFALEASRDGLVLRNDCVGETGAVLRDK